MGNMYFHIWGLHLYVIAEKVVICCGSIFSPWFRVEFEFPLYFGFVIYMCNNEFEESEIEI